MIYTSAEHKVLYRAINYPQQEKQQPFLGLNSSFKKKDGLEPPSCFLMMAHVEEIILGDTVISMNPFQV